MTYLFPLRAKPMMVVMMVVVVSSTSSPNAPSTTLLYSSRDAWEGCEQPSAQECPHQHLQRPSTRHGATRHPFSQFIKGVLLLRYLLFSGPSSDLIWHCLSL